MHENEAANSERMPITVDTLGEIKRDQIENYYLLFVNVLLSPSLYMLIQLFSSISVNSGFRIFTSMLGMSVNILPLFTSISENNC